MTGLRWRDVDFAKGGAVLHETGNKHEQPTTLASQVFKALDEIAGALRYKTLDLPRRHVDLTKGHFQGAMLDTAEGIVGNW